MSTAAQLRLHVETLEPGAIVHVRDLPGSRASVETAVSRLASDGDLVRIRKGVYFRPAPGTPRPDPVHVGIAIAGPGSGPAGLSAARHFGMTTQVPAVATVAVAGRAPTGLDDVHFVARPPRRREVGLTPHEVALIELLRDLSSVAERPLAALAAVLPRPISDGRIRPALIRRTVASEWHVAARRRLDDLEALLAATAAA